LILSLLGRPGDVLYMMHARAVEILPQPSLLASMHSIQMGMAGAPAGHGCLQS
jgi:hypothetical protein